MDHTLGPTDPSKKKKRVLSPLPSRKRLNKVPQCAHLVFLSPPSPSPPSRHVPESNTEPSSDTRTQVRLSTLLRPAPVPPSPLYVRGGFWVDRLSRLGVKPTTNPPPRSTLTTMLSLKYPVSSKYMFRAFQGTLIRVTSQSTRSILIVHRACTACEIRTAGRLTPSPLSSGVLSWAARTKSSRSVRYTPPWRINIPGIKPLVTRGRYVTRGGSPHH